MMQTDETASIYMHYTTTQLLLFAVYIRLVQQHML